MSKLVKLNVNIFPGPDGIHPEVLCEIKDVILILFTIIYKQSLEAGELPPVWKDALISALHKKGNERKATN